VNRRPGILARLPFHLPDRLSPELEAPPTITHASTGRPGILPGLLLICLNKLSAGLEAHLPSLTGPPVDRASLPGSPLPIHPTKLFLLTGRPGILPGIISICSKKRSAGLETTPTIWYIDYQMVGRASCPAPLLSKLFQSEQVLFNSRFISMRKEFPFQHFDCIIN
jgi:hypothetical protein